MRKYVKEVVVILLQCILFYVCPLIAKGDEMIGMVLLMIIASFILSLVLGIISKEKIKFGYPVIVSLLFIPTVFIYYNESALVHALWYLVITSLGLLLGACVNKMSTKK